MRGIVALVFVAAAIVVASQKDIPRFRGGIDVVQFTVTVPVALAFQLAPANDARRT